MRLGIATDNQQFRICLEHLSEQLRSDVAAADSLPVHGLTRNCRSLEMLFNKISKQETPPAPKNADDLLSDIMDIMAFDHVFNDRKNETVPANPRSKQYEKVFLHLLCKLLNDIPKRLTDRQRAKIAIELIRWAGGHPASLASMARYIRGVRRRLYGLAELTSK